MRRKREEEKQIDHRASMFVCVCVCGRHAIGKREKRREKHTK